MESLGAGLPVSVTFHGARDERDFVVTNSLDVLYTVYTTVQTWSEDVIEREGVKSGAGRRKSQERLDGLY